MILVVRYVVERVEGEGVHQIKSLRAPFCPKCGALCSGYDRCLRRVVGDDGITVTYRLRRVRCPFCGALHVELPDFMRPCKHYAAAVIDGDSLEMLGFCGKKLSVSRAEVIRSSIRKTYDDLQAK